jgi:hypothetical protein
VRDIVKGVRQPALLLDCAEDVRYAGTRRAARYMSDARTQPRPAGVAARAEVLGEFFA